MRTFVLVWLVAVLLAPVSRAKQPSVRIGVQSGIGGPYADAAGSVTTACLAVEESKVLDRTRLGVQAVKPLSAIYLNDCLRGPAAQSAPHQ